MSKRNQTIAIARYLAYKNNLNRQLESLDDEAYLKNPLGLDVGRYIDDLMKYCPESTVDTVLNNPNAIILRLGEEQINILAFMDYENERGVKINA